MSPVTRGSSSGGSSPHMAEPPGVPHEPGCYLFRAESGEIIYIGKAKDLKNRVSTYFHSGNHDAKTNKMLSHAVALDFIVTSNEVEALLLENTLIKQHQPRYNIDLKDAKNYAWIRLTADRFPRLEVTRQPDGTGQVFGPYVSAAARDALFSFVKKTFCLRTCRRLPRRGCLRYHMGSCSAPCRDGISPGEYAEDVRRAAMVLKGRSTELVRELGDQMARASVAEDFEQAIRLRDQIAALERCGSRQVVKRDVTSDEDVITWRFSGETVYLMVFRVHAGTLHGKEQYVIPRDEEVIEQFIVQYYGGRSPPDILILPEDPGPAVAGFLAHQAGHKIAVVVPRIGSKKKLLDLAAKNLEIVFFAGEVKVRELGERLNMASDPHRIECFDISHIQGTDVVGGMVSFLDGKPDKRQYRRFRIRTVEGIDDVAAIREVVRRRYTRLRDEGSALPDLVLIDGGRGQLHGAAKEIHDLGIQMPVVSIAKGEEKVYAPGSPHPVLMDRTEPAALYLQEIRDEAHRFAVTYHRLLRRKGAVK